MRPVIAENWCDAQRRKPIFGWQGTVGGFEEADLAGNVEHAALYVHACDVAKTGMKASNTDMVLGSRTDTARQSSVFEK